MQTMPTTITIQLERADDRRSGWRARTRVDGDPADAPRVRIATSTAAPASTFAGEAADAAWAPTPYEPGPCTCEDGHCDRDHEHE